MVCPRWTRFFAHNGRSRLIAVMHSQPPILMKISVFWGKVFCFTEETRSKSADKILVYFGYVSAMLSQSVNPRAISESSKSKP